jgi:hypothetical protein
MVDVLFTRVDWSEYTNTDGAKKRREEGNKESVQGQHLYRGESPFSLYVYRKSKLDVAVGFTSFFSCVCVSPSIAPELTGS